MEASGTQRMGMREHESHTGCRESRVTRSAMQSPLILLSFDSRIGARPQLFPSSSVSCQVFRDSPKKSSLISSCLTSSTDSGYQLDTCFSLIHLPECLLLRILLRSHLLHNSCKSISLMIRSRSLISGCKEEGCLIRMPLLPTPVDVATRRRG